MPFDPTSMAISAGMNLLGPLAGKAIDSIFGGLSPEERQARANLERLAGGGSSPEDAMLQAQRAKTQSNLAAMAARGTAQQQAGQTRMAMQMAPEIQQQQAAQLAAQRAQRMQAAQRDLATLQQQQGSQQRQFMQNLVGAGLQGGAAMGAQAMMQNEDKPKPTVRMSGATVNQPQAPAPATSGMTAAPGAVPSTGAMAPATTPAATPLALGQSAAPASKFTAGLAPMMVAGGAAGGAAGADELLSPYRLGRRRLMGGY